jgi:hypothetical protein
MGTQPISLRRFLEGRHIDPRGGVRSFFSSALRGSSPLAANFSSAIPIGALIPKVHPQGILETTMSNASFDTSRPTWAKDIAGGHIFLRDDSPRYEWTQVFNPSEQFEAEDAVISGTALLPDISTKDVPFTHPFGFDWECYIVPDPPYTSLLAPSNTGIDPDTGQVLEETHEYHDATTYAATQFGLAVPKGVLGVETDQDLVPPEYRAHDGDRAVVIGRWIVDCGHPGYHTEIHPPLLFVTGRSMPGNKGTTSRIIIRPYLVGQEFGDGALRQHLFSEVEKALIPGGSLHVEARPQILPKPFRGVHLFTFLVRPPTPQPAPNVPLFVSFHFTKRRGRGVALEIIQKDTETIEVVIAMNGDAYAPPPLPSKEDWTISVGDLKDLSPEALADYSVAILAGLFVNPAGAAVLAKGLQTDRYATPQASSTLDGQNVVVTTADKLPNPTPVSEDDAQPFPLYGWLNVEWGHPASPINIDGPTQSDADLTQPLRFFLHPSDINDLRPIVNTIWRITNPGTVRVEQVDAEQFVVTFLSNPPHGQAGWFITAEVTDRNHIVHATGLHSVFFKPGEPIPH